MAQISDRDVFDLLERTSDAEIANGATAFKCAPPIRERQNREFLWRRWPED